MHLGLATVGVLVAVILPPLPWSAEGAARAPAQCGGRTATIVGTETDDDLVGTPRRDVVYLGFGDDRFAGRGGDDLVCGGPGDDVLLGQRGDDTLRGEEGRDSLWDDPTVAVRGGDGADVLKGGPDDDRLWLSAGDGVGRGAGADTADGGGGEDTVGYRGSPVGVRLDVTARTGTGAGGTVDTFTNAEGPWVGSSHGDVLDGSDRRDVLRAGRAVDGRDRVYGHAKRDVLSAEVGLVVGGPGGDTYLSPRGVQGDLDLVMGAGPDDVTLEQGGPVLLRGGPHVDQVLLNPGPGRLLARLSGGEAGEDRDALSFRDITGPVRVDLRAGEASYPRGTLVVRHFETVVGGEAGDVLLGDAGPNLMFGLNDRDILRGRGGPDSLYGEAGRPDRAFGGPGRDYCSAERSHGCERGTGRTAR